MRRDYSRGQHCNLLMRDVNRCLNIALRMWDSGLMNDTAVAPTARTPEPEAKPTKTNRASEGGNPEQLSLPSLD